jgi:cobalt-zinc-cadmium efflux system membrane fusion protein
MTPDIQPPPSKKRSRFWRNTRSALVVLAAIAAGVNVINWPPRADQPESARPRKAEGPAAPALSNSVTLSEVEERPFEITHTTVGNIDFNQDSLLQVFTPYPGHIAKLLAKAGDDVKKGQELFLHR